MNKTSVRVLSISVSKSNFFSSQANATIECGSCGSLFAKDIPYSNRVSTSCPDCGTINTSNIEWEQPKKIVEDTTDYGYFWFKVLIGFVVFVIIGTYLKSLEQTDKRTQTNIEVSYKGTNYG